MSSSPTGSFDDHLVLLQQFLTRRREIVDTVEATLLNVQGKEISRNRDRRYFEQQLNSCFFGAPGLPRQLLRLRGQLAAAHLADGFEPLPIDRFASELDPLELILRAYGHWELHRWPGKAGRLTYAQTIYTVFVLRYLESLSLRIWDDGEDRAEHHLHEIQVLLDRLNELEAGCVFVRDARWLIQTAQGPLTRLLSPYFRIAERISGSLTDEDRLEIHAAGAKLAGGHLRSQLRYGVWKSSRSIDDPDVLSVTRNSNSMDNALLVRDLVAALEAYRQACTDLDAGMRSSLADAILQGLSADPELFVTRLDLLAPYTMIEDLFTVRGGDGPARYTSMGAAHLALLERYATLIGDLAESLKEDASNLDPRKRIYSPYGIVYGFVADVMSNMAIGTLLAQPSLDLCLEDFFSSRGRLEDKVTRAAGWEKLPRREGEREHFEHSIEFANEVFTRLMSSLDARARHPTVANASRLHDARILVVPASVPIESLPDGCVSADCVRAEEYCFTSDWQRALSGGATAIPRNRMLDDRREARFLASVESDGKWLGVSKILLTQLIAQGKDALIAGVDPVVIDLLRLTCPGLVVTPSGNPNL